jgi:polyisoprenyl-phosphate glycosyltransferase
VKSNAEVADKKAPLLSIVIPCYNEERVLEVMFERLSNLLNSLNHSAEVILVDDGSKDSTWERMERIREQDLRWKLIRFSRNFGHQVAVSAGIRHASGDCIIVLDADLQDPPEVLERFIEKWQHGYDVVYGIRRKRKETIFKRFAYKTFYALLAKLSSINMPLDAGDFCLMDRRVVDVINSMQERSPFVRGLRAWAGFKQIGIEYEREARAAGESQYSLWKLCELAFDGIFSFSVVPLRLTTYFGLIVSLCAFLAAFFTLIQRLFAEYYASFGLGPVPGFATVAIGIFFLGGVQLISLGILGEYVGRIYKEVKGRPQWVISQTKGL